jgi:small nuclear ribonucleoprotein (snRNP)-like protein
MLINPIIRFLVRLNKGREVSGILIGYDPFLNLVIEEDSMEVDLSPEKRMMVS